MIHDYVVDIASQLGMELSKVSMVEGQRLGCTDTCLLNIGARGCIVSALVFQTDLANLEKGFNLDRLELRIRSALLRLHRMIEG